MQISKASIEALFVMTNVLKRLNLISSDSPLPGNARSGFSTHPGRCPCHFRRTDFINHDTPSQSKRTPTMLWRR